MTSQPTTDSKHSSARRPLTTRAAAWSRALAGALASRRISPNLISLCSLGLAVIGALALVGAHFLQVPAWQSAAFIVAAGCIQLRLLANMLDGMVAVEGGLGGPLGDIYNEFPDRLSDTILLVAAGYVALGGTWPAGDALGWLAGSLALLTAYTRAMGASIGARHAFQGPMAKPQRMALLTCACLVAAVAAHWGLVANVMYLALVIMIVGMVVTLVRRLRVIARELEAAPESAAS